MARRVRQSHLKSVRTPLPVTIQLSILARIPPAKLGQGTGAMLDRAEEWWGRATWARGSVDIPPSEGVHGWKDSGGKSICKLGCGFPGSWNSGAAGRDGSSCCRAVWHPAVAGHCEPLRLKAIQQVDPRPLGPLMLNVSPLERGGRT
jgi:hypothetical protein